MGAKLQYAKVIDREIFYAKGGRVQPHLENVVVVADAPGPAGAFLVLRGWTGDHGTTTETWRVEGSGGGVLYESVSREIHLSTENHVEKLEDEIADLDFQYPADDYTIVFTLDDRDVARVTFSVKVPERDDG